MILLFPPLQSPWPTRVCSPSPTGLVRQNGEEKMKSEMLGVNLRQLLEKKNQALCRLQCDWPLVPESIFSVAYSTEDIFLEKTAFQKTWRLVDMDNQGPIVTPCPMNVWWNENTTFSPPQTFHPRRQFLHEWLWEEPRCRPFSVHTMGEGIFWKVEVRERYGWWQNGDICQRQEARGS